nr:hypothetical protein [Tanacetum cinerariifolium]
MLCVIFFLTPTRKEVDIGLGGGCRRLLTQIGMTDFVPGRAMINASQLRVLSSSGVAPYNDATLEDLKTKHLFKPSPSLLHIFIDHHHLVASPAVVLDRIKSFPRGTSCGRDGLRAQHLMDCLSVATVAISDELVSSITQVVNLFLDGKCPQHVGCGYCLEASDFQGGGEAILHAVNRLIEDRGDDVGLSMLLVDFKNTFNFVDREDLDLIMKDGPSSGLHLNADKTEVFLPKEDPRSRLAGIFPLNIARPLHGVKLLGGPASVDFDFSSELVMKRLTKTIVLMDMVASINDPQCELMLLRACAASGATFDDALCMFNTKMKTGLLSNLSEIATLKLMKKLTDIYFIRVTQTAESNFSLSSRQMALWQSQMKDHTSDWLRVVLISGLGQTMNAFLASILQSASLQTKLLLLSGNVASGPAFNDALCAFNTKMETDLLINATVLSLLQSLYGGYIWRPCCIFAGIIGIKHRHNVVRDTLADICFQSGISAEKEVDNGLGGGWSSPLTQTGMVDFVPGRAVIDASHHKRVKYEAKCADIAYGFLPFLFAWGI